MAQPVKLSDPLVLDARLVSELSNRSIAGQIEHWAALGRAVEGVLRTDEALNLKRLGALRSLSAVITSVETDEGRGRLERVLEARPYPHFEASTSTPGLLVRIEADGTRTLGRFVNRAFRAADVE